MDSNLSLRLWLLLSLVGFFHFGSVACVSADEPSVPGNPSAVEALGLFASTRATQEHVYGYVLQLWRDSGKVFGLLSVYEGPPEAMSRSIIAPVALADTGELNFSSSGKHFRYSFSGLLSQNGLEGVVETSVIGREDQRTISERVSLSRDATAFLEIPAGYKVWREKWEKILR